ncbi:ABC transporter ATP-binding protein [Ancylobacter sp. FA202]|uniref:ABC transporter ATP-binding protein n=1 Tax=Ancylobacter sp. FA202 TaxID=1111106 RepID=UPI0003A1339D|nr:ABC transporter ATP-binding protein [Ancylobacter sp. FA202]
MTSDIPLWSALRAAFRELSPRRRLAVVPLLLLMFTGAVAELVSLGALISFLSLIAQPERIQQAGPVGMLFRAVGAETPLHVVGLSTALFATAALVAMGLRLLLTRATLGFAFGVAYELGVRLFANVLHQSYIYHTQGNSSTVIAAINKAQIVTGELLLPALQAVVATVIALFIIAGLVWVDPLLALLLGGLFAAIYLTMSAITQIQLRRNGKILAQMQEARVKIMQEGLGGIRDILIDRSQPVFIEAYERTEASLRDARAASSFAAQSPRFIVEGLGMIVVAVVAAVLAVRHGGLVDAIPILGVLALGAQRLLPLLQIIYSAWAMSAAGRQSLIDLLRLLARPVSSEPERQEAITFDHALELDRVGYRYGENGRPVLTDICLRIPRGARIGIAGQTGSGKSTLMDLIIGLLEPTEGLIRIDGAPLTAHNRAAWQQHVAHVPQAIFLSDASVTQNIAFGVRDNEVDHDRVRRAAEQAELTDVIAALPEGYATRVGERGIQLSGGQRQRIGIARALYKQASVLVFDEATSALDNDTEASVMRAIERLDRQLTILIIAHRLTTLEGCDEVIRLEKGRILRRPAVANAASTAGS